MKKRKNGKKNGNLTVTGLHVTVEGKAILQGVNLTVKRGEIHAVMGPNGSGKSTLAYAMMGHPSYKYQISNIKYQISKNKKRIKPDITVDGKSILGLSTDERAKAGLFLALQTPLAVPGVSVSHLLRTAFQELHGTKDTGEDTAVQNPVLRRRWKASGTTFPEFLNLVRDYARLLNLDESFLKRGVNDGFSGGEKKKAEMLQALILKPAYVILDEIDTGLDVDALRSVASGIEELRKQSVGIMIITHYQRILDYVKPDFVHIFVDGRIVESGDAALAKRIEQEGYKRFIDMRHTEGEERI